jgi:hypothetical protein
LHATGSATQSSFCRTMRRRRISSQS